jgi:cytochrome c oxidase subunit 2
MLRLNRITTVLFSCLLAWFGVNQAFAEALPRFNMPVGVTPVSKDIYQLHMTIFWICVGIGIAVFSVMFYSLFKHRKSKGYQAAKFSGHVRTEIFWAVIPLLILVAMAVPATTVLMRMDNTDQADINIKITSYQWYWKYEYLDEGISYLSKLSTPMAQIQNYLLEVDKPLVLPINKKIRFLVTSNDVIHSWWVPALGVKRDAIPGFVYESWARITKPGVYRGQCAELCGMNHAYMPIVVIAVSEKEYTQWINSQKTGVKKVLAQEQGDINRSWTLDELMKHGEEVYNNRCAMCHKPDGSGMPPAFPAMKGSKIATGPIPAHMDIVMNGKPGTPMVAWSQLINDVDIAAAITYERNAFGNADKQKYGPNAGGLVEPAQIAKARKN